jgi:predicted phosphodiesterase
MVDKKDWSEQEILLLKDNRPNMTLTELGKVFAKHGFNRSKTALERKAARLGVFYTPIDKFTKIEGEPIQEERSETWKKIVSIKDIYKEYEHRYRGLLNPKTKLRKILSISDFHIPFDRDDLIKAAVEKHKDADILVLNGDILDLHAVSTWPKERSIVLKKEYDIAMEYLKLFSKMFPHVIIVRGNHEYRLNRYFHSNVSPSISFLVNKEILGRLASGEVYDESGNIIVKHDFSNVHYDSGPEAWFTTIGKTMFVHPQAFSSTEGKTAVNAQTYFMERENVDTIILSHTHQQAWIPTRGKLCIETGCLCVPLDYEKQGKMNYKAQTLGYAVVYQDEEGNCDYNKTHVVYLGVQYPIKKTFDDLLDEEEKC